MIKNPPANAEDVGSIPERGRSPGGGNYNLLQYSCLENPMDRGAWRAIVHEVAKETQLSTHTDAFSEAAFLKLSGERIFFFSFYS